MITWVITFAQETPPWLAAPLIIGIYLAALESTGLLLPRLLSRLRANRADTNRDHGLETQERRYTKDAPVSPRPEPQPASGDEPFSLEPVKRREPPKPNGEFDIYMSIRVTNSGSGSIQGCCGRLVRVSDFVSTPDGFKWQDIPHIHPALLRWSPGDGGGDSVDFTKEATLDVAFIESWAEPIYQILTANEVLRPTYQLKYEQTGPFLTIEISTQSGGRIEQIFALGGHSRDFLKTPTEVEPVVTLRRWP